MKSLFFVLCFFVAGCNASFPAENECEEDLDEALSDLNQCESIVCQPVECMYPEREIIALYREDITDTEIDTDLVATSRAELAVLYRRISELESLVNCDEN